MTHTTEGTNNIDLTLLRGFWVQSVHGYYYDAHIRAIL